MGESILRDRLTLYGARNCARLSKGNPVNIPEPGCGAVYGNVKELGDAGSGPG